MLLLPRKLLLQYPLQNQVRQGPVDPLVLPGRLDHLAAVDPLETVEVRVRRLPVLHRGPVVVPVVMAVVVHQDRQAGVLLVRREALVAMGHPEVRAVPE